MTRFFLDTETNGWSGEVMSLALVREDGESLYLMDSEAVDIARSRDFLGDMLDPWFAANVLPLMHSVPAHVLIHDYPKRDWPLVIGEFLYRDDTSPAQVFADFPLDIRALLGFLMVDVKESVAMPQQTHFTVLRRIRVYPTDLVGCVRHNAWWDAMALRRWMEVQQS